MFPDSWFTAFTDASGVVALNTDEVTEDSAASGDVNDLAAKAITSEGKLRIAVSSL